MCTKDPTKETKEISALHHAARRAGVQVIANDGKYVDKYSRKPIKLTTYATSHSCALGLVRNASLDGKVTQYIACQLASGDVSKFVRNLTQIIALPSHKSIIKPLAIYVGSGSAILVYPTSNLSPLVRRIWMTDTIQPRLRTTSILIIMSDIAEGIKHLHSHGMTHGRLNSESVYLDTKSHAVIMDHGWTQSYTSSSNPPPIANDIVAFGVVCWEMIEHKSPPEDIHNMKFSETSDPILGELIKITKWCLSLPDHTHPFDRVLDSLKSILIVSA